MVDILRMKVNTENTHTHRFNSYLPEKSGLAGCPIHSKHDCPPAIFSMQGYENTLHIGPEMSCMNHDILKVTRDSHPFSVD